MIRIATVAALAALTAAPAFAGESIRISTAGKSVEQVRAEVTLAARRVCARQIVGATFPTSEMQSCLKRTVASTFAQAQNPAFKLAEK